jgi:hypothetical protein
VVIEWKKGKEVEDRKEGQEKVIRVGRYVYGPEESIKECKIGEKEQKGDREKREEGEKRRRRKRNRRNGKNDTRKQEKGGEEKHTQCPPFT